MALPKPEPGLVIAYSYLWHSQQVSGASEGRKTRPCAIVVAAADKDGDVQVYVAPITHSEPNDPHAVEVPERVKQKLGLDAKRSWIVTSELNRFIGPGYDLRPIARDKPDVFAWGFLPTETFATVKHGIAANQKGRRLRTTSRED